jgi:RNA polymerase primary sigma factor
MASFDRSALAKDLHDLLIKKPKQNKYQLRNELLAKGWGGISTSDINSVLYSNRQLFKHSDDTLPFWFGLGASTLLDETLKQRNVPHYSGPKLRDWQREAFEAWKRAGRRGVVEAVTGTGKTAVGIYAAADAAERGLRCYVLVPGRDLLDQWYSKLVSELPDLKIGRFGDRWADTLRNHDVIVGTVQSSCRNPMLPNGHRGLLIADEVHRYGADKYALALEPAFGERLGLTATYEREDNGIERHLTPYFLPLGGKNAGEEIVANCSYARALNDGILAHFKVGLMGVDFSPNEQIKYDELDARVKHNRSHLIRQHNCPESPYGEFMKAVSRLGQGNHGDFEATRRARQYLDAFSKRRSLLADCNRKMEAVRALESVLSSSGRAIIFTETIESSEIVASILNSLCISAKAYTSALDRVMRKQLLSDFRLGHTRVLAAPRVLDEGIDIPQADLGVIIAASRSRRQMIQRIGRIIRPKTNNRSATFIILYVKNTSEDPELGAHSAFLSQMVDNADEVEYFSSDVQGQELLDWYVNQN